jgi:hypothetical protein
MFAIFATFAVKILTAKNAEVRRGAEKITDFGGGQHGRRTGTRICRVER